MPNLLKNLNPAVWLTGGLLALVQFPVHGHGIKLDTRPMDEVNRHLQTELTSGFKRHGLRNDVEYPLARLKAEILYALSDADDDEDSDDEGYIDEEELEREMKEAGTSLEAVVDEALNQANMAANSEPRSPTGAFAGDPRPGYLRVSDVLRVAGDSIAHRRGDGMLAPPAAMNATIAVLDAKIYKGR
jgi:hypothetical protein